MGPHFAGEVPLTQFFFKRIGSTQFTEGCKQGLVVIQKKSPETFGGWGKPAGAHEKQNICQPILQGTEKRVMLIIRWVEKKGWGGQCY